MKKINQLLLACAFSSLATQVFSAELISSEKQKRQAAAGFVLPATMALSVLRLECRHWLLGMPNDVDVVAKDWWARNKEDIDTATWIVGDAFKEYREKMTPENASIAEMRVMEVLTNGQIDIVRKLYNEKIPTPGACINALKRYQLPIYDFSNLGSNAGLESSAEFAFTLKATRADKKYKPDLKNSTFDIRVPVASSPLGTIDSYQSAVEDKNGPKANEVVMTLTERKIDYTKWFKK